MIICLCEPAVAQVQRPLVSRRMVEAPVGCFGKLGDSVGLCRVALSSNVSLVQWGMSQVVVCWSMYQRQYDSRKRLYVCRTVKTSCSRR